MHYPPGLLAKHAGTDRAERRPQHVITGVDRDFRGKVQEALDNLEPTRDVKVLQVVMDQMTKTVIEAQKFAYEQEARLMLCSRRVEGIDAKLDDQDARITQMQEGMGNMGVMFGEKAVQLDQEHAERQKVLHAFLAVQEGLINDRFKEINETFQKCDELFKATAAQTAASTGQATSSSPVPAAPVKVWQRRLSRRPRLPRPSCGAPWTLSKSR